jgi:hypothetical protein
MNKHVLIFFISLFPENLRKSALQTREREYLTSIRQTKRFLENRNWDIIFCENTVSTIDKLKLTSLWIELEGQKLLLLDNNKGSINKGIGELDMMVNASEHYCDIFDHASTISYFTGRRIMTNLYLIDKSENMKKSALISNPDFLYLDGTYSLVEKNFMYNDMFFTMNREVFFKYTEFVKESLTSLISSKTIGSEQLLFQFINECDIEYEWLPALGLMRREVRRFGIWSKEKWHIC